MYTCSLVYYAKTPNGLRFSCGVRDRIYTRKHDLYKHETKVYIRLLYFSLQMGGGIYYMEKYAINES